MCQKVAPKQNNNNALKGFALNNMWPCHHPSNPGSSTFGCIAFQSDESMKSFSAGLLLLHFPLLLCYDLFCSNFLVTTVTGKELCPI